LNAAFDRLEEKHTLFGGGIETVPVQPRQDERDRPSRTPWRQGNGRQCSKGCTEERERCPARSPNANLAPPGPLPGTTCHPDLALLAL
jgi:hypothetical protein